MATCQVTLAASPSAPSSPQEILRDTNASMVNLISSPVKDNRNENCYNCGEQLSPTHQCYETAMTEIETLDLAQPPSPAPSPAPSPTPSPAPSPKPSPAPSPAPSPNISPHAVPNTAASALLTSAAFYDAFLPTTSEQESKSLGQRLASLEKDVPLVFRCWQLSFPRMPHDTIVSVLEKNLRKHKALPFPDGWVSSVLSKYNLGPDSSTVSQLF